MKSVLLQQSPARSTSGQARIFGAGDQGKLMNDARRCYELSFQGIGEYV